MDTIVKLQFPFVASGVKYNEIRVRRPKARDMRRVAGMSNLSDVDRTHQMLVDLTEVPSADLDELDASDYNSLSMVVQSFMKPSQET